MLYYKNVGKGYGRHWRGIIMDRAYKNLDDIVSKSQRWFSQLRGGGKFYSGKADYKWVWPSGEELLFRQLKNKDDYYNYHGQEFAFLGWNELTKYPDDELYKAMMSCNRSSYLPPEGSDIPEIPLVVVSTTNPYGVGHNWVKRRFIDNAPCGKMQSTETEVFNPRTQKREVYRKNRVSLFFSYKENPYLSPSYIAELESITEENKRKAWLEGDWEITAGGALDDLWGPHCLVPRFQVPEGWKVDRSFDWGSTHPFSVGWWAEADGTDAVLPDGRIWCPPKGSLVRIYELYGTRELGTNKGIALGPAVLAREINAIEERLMEQGWIRNKPWAGPADNQIDNVTNSETRTIAQSMSEEGVYWTKSDKAAGSRKQGLELARERLSNAKHGEGPGLFFCENCKAALYLLSTLPRDEDDLDDVDTQAEDHIWDETRYRVLASSYRPTSIEVKYPR
jgi:hypothetical protein